MKEQNRHKRRENKKSKIKNKETYFWVVSSINSLIMGRNVFFLSTYYPKSVLDNLI